MEGKRENGGEEGEWRGRGRMEGKREDGGEEGEWRGRGRMEGREMGRGIGERMRTDADREWVD